MSKTMNFFFSLGLITIGGMASAPEIALAMQADQLEVIEYGKSGAWKLRKAVADGEVQSCDAYMLTGSEQGLRFDFSRQESLIAFSGMASAVEEGAQDVEVWFDDNREESQAITMTLDTDAEGFSWRTYHSSNDEPDGLLDLLSNASTIHFSYMIKGEGEHEEKFSLKGSNAIFKKTIACLDQPVGTKKSNVSAKVEKSPVKLGSCKLIVDGSKYVDIKEGCSIWFANDGTGAFWINTDRDTFLGDYFAEVVPNGDGTASVNWNGEKGATHAQSFLGEDFRLKKNGCWVNDRAKVCAAQ